MRQDRDTSASLGPPPLAPSGSAFTGARVALGTSQLGSSGSDRPFTGNWESGPPDGRVCRSRLSQCVPYTDRYAARRHSRWLVRGRRALCAGTPVSENRPRRGFFVSGTPGRYDESWRNERTAPERCPGAVPSEKRACRWGASARPLTGSPARQGARPADAWMLTPISRIAHLAVQSVVLLWRNTSSLGHEALGSRTFVASSRTSARPT